MTKHTGFRRWSVAVGVMTGIAALLVSGVLQSHAVSAQESDSGQQVYFEETGQVLDGPFLETWAQTGGMERHGSPVTPVTQVGDLWIQWFEYSRFDLAGASPGQATADDVSIVPVGQIYAKKLSYSRSHAAFQPRSEGGEAEQFFAETGHSLANGFLATYENGSHSEWLGLPISQEFSMEGRIYQFFKYGALAWSDGNGASRIAIGTLDAMLSGQYQSGTEKPEGAMTYGPNALAAIYGTDDLMWNESLASQRWIEVDLSNYTLTAYVGDVPVLSTLVVTGASVSPTVTGEFRIHWKLPVQDMQGTDWRGEPYLAEDVPSVMYFFEDYAIHGAYWRDGFGYSASHGCVNVPVETAETLYEWAGVGTTVRVRE